MWLLQRKADRKTAAHDRASNADLRHARARTRALEDDQPTTANEATIRAAEKRTDDLEERADRVAESLLDRLRLNHFAEGIAMAWGQQTQHRHRGGV